jgi:hypothetical protein
VNSKVTAPEASVSSCGKKNAVSEKLERSSGGGAGGGGGASAGVVTVWSAEGSAIDFSSMVADSSDLSFDALRVTTPSANPSPSPGTAPRLYRRPIPPIPYPEIGLKYAGSGSGGASGSAGKSSCHTQKLGPWPTVARSQRLLPRCP